MELVTAISKRKLASIDVIGMEEVPFERVLGKEIGAALQKVPPKTFLIPTATLTLTQRVSTMKAKEFDST
jgi:hypothetical protein